MYENMTDKFKPVHDKFEPVHDKFKPASSHVYSEIKTYNYYDNEAASTSSSLKLHSHTQENKTNDYGDPQLSSRTSTMTQSYLSLRRCHIDNSSIYYCVPKSQQGKTDQL